MSLRVWLPLNGNLENKGLSNVVATAGGTAAVNSAGKIGSCYKVGTSVGYINIPKEAMTGFTNACSLSFWVNINSWNTSYATLFQAGPASTPWTSYVFGVLRNNANSTLCFTISNGSSSSQASYLTSTISLSTWYHMTFTYETGKCKIYLNGALDHEYTTSIVPAFTNITTITAGSCTNKSSYACDCKFNDIRIYDHCLSPLEVKEISQGLVLHYPLNDFYNESTTNLAAGSAGKNYITKEVAAYATSIKGKTQYENKIYTYSAYIKNTSDNPLAVRFNPYNADDSSYSAFNGNYIQPGHEGYSTVTVDISDTTKWNGKVILYVQNGNAGTVPTNKTFYIKEVQLEQKDFATIYTDETRIQTTISDCSGFGNNGTIINSSTHKKDGARYNASMSFNGVDQCIQIPNLSTILTDTTYTMNVWFKKVTGEWSTKSWETIFGGPSGFELELKNGSSNSPVLYAYSWNKGNTTYTLDEWHMLTMVRTSSGTTFYLDGIQAFTGTAGSIPSGNYFIGSWRDSTSQNMRGYVSDFRLYSTALSEADIKSLYNTSANIDNLGNFHSFEFVETNNNLVNSDLTTWSKESNVTCVFNSTTGFYDVDTHRDSSITSRWGIYKDIAITPSTNYVFAVDMKDNNSKMYAGTYTSTPSGFPSSYGNVSSTTKRYYSYFTSGSSDTLCRLYLCATPSTNMVGHFVNPYLGVASTNKSVEKNGIANFGNIVELNNEHARISQFGELGANEFIEK